MIRERGIQKNDRRRKTRSWSKGGGINKTKKARERKKGRGIFLRGVGEGELVWGAER